MTPRASRGRRVWRPSSSTRRPGEAFNRLDTRTGFIETVEREELLAAVHTIVDEAPAAYGLNPAGARDALVSGVQAVRGW